MHQVVSSGNVSSTADTSPWPAIILLCVGQVMVILDGTIVNLALTMVQRSLGFSQQGLAWVINAYLIAFGGLLLLAGRLADLYGRKRVLLLGLIVFTGASLLCGASNESEVLVAARFLQGAGGAAMSGVTLGMIVALCRSPEERVKAIGVYSFAQSAGGSIGLLAGGVLAQMLSWRWVFWVNLPIGIVLILLIWKRLTADTRRRSGETADVPGAVLITSALMLAVYAIVQMPDRGWTSAHTVGGGSAAAVLFAGFAWRQTTADKPLLPPRILRSPLTSLANLVMALMVAGMFGFQFLGSLYLQQVLSFDPIGTGLGILPVALVIGFFSLFLTARLIARFDTQPVLLSGLALIVAGLALLSRAPLDAIYLVDLLPVMLLLGAGFGMAMPALASLAMSHIAPEDSGLGSGLFNTAQQIGGALGLAILATLAALRVDITLAQGREALSALAAGYGYAFGAAAGLVALATLIAATFLRTASARAADRMASKE